MESEGSLPHSHLPATCPYPVISGSLSPRHGESSGCGWRNSLQYGGCLRIYWIRNRGRPIWGGFPACGLGDVLITPHRKNVSCYKTFKQKASTKNKTANPWVTNQFYITLLYNLNATCFVLSTEKPSSG